MRFEGACRAAGVDGNEDFNGATRAGVGQYQFLVRDGVRDSTFEVKGFEPAREGQRAIAHDAPDAMLLRA